MTRINLVPVDELSDQHLIREYNELPRCVKQNIDTSNAPVKYLLGTGHMKWAKKHTLYLIRRYSALCYEMCFRGFAVNYPVIDLCDYHAKNTAIENNNDYSPDDADVELSRSRIKEKYLLKPTWYRWTNRTKPYYLEN